MSNTLYRKYRPKRFSEVIGQQAIIKTLINSLKKENNCFIFSGTRGTGKTSIAKIIAQYVNCLDNKEDVCLKCENCLKILHEGLTDVIELDAASNNSVEDIRSIIASVDYLPQSLKKKIYIIDEAHMLSQAAWNALLKTLESLPNHVLFIFATTEFHKIPLTIVSRCDSFHLANLNLDELKTLIINVCKNENIKIDDPSIHKLALLANGSARDCLTLLQQTNNYCLNDININKINTLFKLIDNGIFLKLINALQDNLKDDFYTLFFEITKTCNVQQFLNNFINILFDLYLYKTTNDINLLQYLNLNEIKNFKIIDETLLLKLLEILKDTLSTNPINYLTHFKINTLSLFKQKTDDKITLDPFEGIKSIIAYNDNEKVKALNQALEILKKDESISPELHLNLNRINQITHYFNQFVILVVNESYYISSLIDYFKNNKETNLFAKMNILIYPTNVLKDYLTKLKNLKLAKTDIVKLTTKELKGIFKIND